MYIYIYVCVSMCEIEREYVYVVYGGKGERDGDRSFVICLLWHGTVRADGSLD
jgi:hypothetical protein